MSLPLLPFRILFSPFVLSPFLDSRFLFLVFLFSIVLTCFFFSVVSLLSVYAHRESGFGLPSCLLALLLPTYLFLPFHNLFPSFPRLFGFNFRASPVFSYSILSFRFVVFSWFLVLSFLFSLFFTGFFSEKMSLQSLEAAL